MAMDIHCKFLINFRTTKIIIFFFSTSLQYILCVFVQPKKSEKVNSKSCDTI